jgi:Fe-S-cluster-containing hydrogenase component 2
MIATNVEACTGCRMCELVCSFHHQQVFSPELSSIRVTRNNRTAGIKLAIDSSCDRCQGEETIQCIKCCCFGALQEVASDAH